MLVISRRPGESILIGENIEVQVLETGPSRVKLGITAPRTVPVLRNEVRLTQDQNRAAAQGIALDRLAPALSRLRPHWPVTTPPAPKITSSSRSCRR
jgi:carbon storage regulator